MLSIAQTDAVFDPALIDFSSNMPIPRWCITKTVIAQDEIYVGGIDSTMKLKARTIFMIPLSAIQLYAVTYHSFSHLVSTNLNLRH